MNAIDFANKLWNGTPANVQAARDLALGYIRTTDLPEAHKPFLASAMYIVVMSYLERAVTNHEHIDTQACINKAIAGADNTAELPFPHNQPEYQQILMLDMVTYARCAMGMLKEGAVCYAV